MLGRHVALTIAVAVLLCEVIWWIIWAVDRPLLWNFAS